uniref:Vacuolar ATPase assembly protein VMA22 n=1 Tax=Acrobeloides nanus TaxID=290746 RepID=A0A914C5J9_9BILA
MEPNFRVSVNKDSFSIFNDENGDPSNEDSKEKESKNLRKRQKSKDEEETKDKDEKGEEKKEKPPKHPFRPFGLLEPQSAKLARQQIQKCSLPLVLELASLRMQISNIEDSMKVEYKTSS